MEEMRRTMLVQILDNEARERCKNRIDGSLYGVELYLFYLKSGKDQYGEG
jgi:hypothetical protein